MKFHMTTFLGSVSMMVGFTASVAMADEAAGVGQLTKSNLRGLEAERDLGAKKVAICHNAPPNKDGSVPKNTLLVPSGALETHLAHGDTLGSCEDGTGGGPNNNACFQGIRIPKNERIFMTVTLPNVQRAGSGGQHDFTFYGPNDDSEIVATYKISIFDLLAFTPDGFPECIDGVLGCEECPPSEPGGTCRQLVHQYDVTDAFEGVSCVGKVLVEQDSKDGVALAAIDLARGSYYLGDRGLTKSEPRVPFLWFGLVFIPEFNTCDAPVAKGWLLDVISSSSAPEDPEPVDLFDGTSGPDVCNP